MPEPPPPSPAVMLLALGRLVRQDVDSALQQHALSVRHVSALGHLARDPGLSYSELARRAGITAQSMQATLRQLEERGAVEKRTLPGRGRTARLHLTAIGERLLAHGQDAISRIDSQLGRELTSEQRSQLTGLLMQVFTEALRQSARTG